MAAMKPRRKSPLQLLVQDRTGRDLDILLRELYVDERHSQDAIADALSTKVGETISRSTVKQWLAQRGITRDERPAVTL